MRPSLRLLVCRNYMREAQAILSSEGWTDVFLSPRGAACASPLCAADHGEPRGSKGRSLEEVQELVECRMPDADSPEVGALAMCLHLFAPAAMVEFLGVRGDFVVVPGWVIAWEDNLDAWGFDRRTAREFFKETARRILLLDTCVLPAAAVELERFGKYVGLPIERYPVGLDVFRGVLRERVAQWRLRVSREQIWESERASGRRAADYGLALDLLRQLAEMMTEEEAIRALQELCSLLFGARRPILCSWETRGLRLARMTTAW